MNTTMNGKQIERIFLSNDQRITTGGQRTLMLSATHHGDRDEFWVVQYEDMVEVARHNCKYIVTIEWA